MPKNTGYRMKKSILTQLFLVAATIGGIEQALASVSAEIIAKTQTCAVCHGQQGVSSNPEWPNLAGQHASYLRKQLMEYQQGTKRQAPIMAGIVASLSEADMKDLAAYYASLPRGMGKVSPTYQMLGEKIYRSGDVDQGITACIACHGPKGGGNDEARFPMLAGQQAAYTIQQLHAFKDKTRSNDLNHIMQDISARMSHKDMEAVAYYMQGLD
jgi:cytochrome c553